MRVACFFDWSRRCVADERFDTRGSCCAAACCAIETASTTAHERFKREFDQRLASLSHAWTNQSTLLTC